MHKKQVNRLRRARRTRMRMREAGAHRLTIFRTPRHIYAQVLTPGGDQTLVAASTVEQGVRGDVKYTGNIDAAAAVGKAIAEKAKAAGIEKVAFDRGGFAYHGRVKALADAAREGGLQF